MQNSTVFKFKTTLFFCCIVLLVLLPQMLFADNIICSYIHEEDVVKCFNCGESVRNDTLLKDGRVLCNLCFPSSIKVGDNVDDILLEVINVMQEFGFDVSKYKIKIEIMNAADIAKHTKVPFTPNHLGLAYTQTKRMIVPFRVIPRTRKHTIYMLDYQPRVRFAATLAHELMHVWQRENGVRPEPKYSEGLSNLAEYLYLSRLNDILANKLLQVLMENDDPIYGDGFREVYDASRIYGFDKLISAYLNNDYLIFK